MEQCHCADMRSARQNQPRALLAGFPHGGADDISSALEAMGWNTTVLTQGTDIEAAFGAQRFDVTVIDTENLDVFAPQLILRLRNTSGPSAAATILAVENTSFEGFRDQLTQAGADLIVPKPSDPKMYMINFTRAATYRLQKIGKRQAG